MTDRIDPPSAAELDSLWRGHSYCLLTKEEYPPTIWFVPCDERLPVDWFEVDAVRIIYGEAPDLKGTVHACGTLIFLRNGKWTSMRGAFPTRSTRSLLRIADEMIKSARSAKGSAR